MKSLDPSRRHDIRVRHRADFNGQLLQLGQSPLGAALAASPANRIVYFPQVDDMNGKGAKPRFGLFPRMALGAVAACLINSIALNAPRHDIYLEGLEIEVHSDIDPSVLFEVKGPESHASCMPKITTEVKVKGDISDEQLREIEKLVHYSPVHGMVEFANTTETRVTRI